MINIVPSNVEGCTFNGVTALALKKIGWVRGTDLAEFADQCVQHQTEKSKEGVVSSDFLDGWTKAMDMMKDSFCSEALEADAQCKFARNVKPEDNSDL